MTPLQLEILLWYHTRLEDFRDLNASAICQAIDDYIDDGMMKRVVVGSEHNDFRSYRLTERAEYFIVHILTTPFPTAYWRIDRDGD